MSKIIYIEIDDQESGPFSVEELNQKLSDDDLGLDSLGWTKGMEDWLPLGDDAFLAMGIQKGPPAADSASPDVSESDGAPDFKITVLVDDQDVGPLSVEEVNQKLSVGEVQFNDLAWYKGLGDWIPLSSDEFIEIGIKEHDTNMEKNSQEYDDVKSKREGNKVPKGKDHEVREVARPPAAKAPKSSKTPKIAKATKVARSRENSDADEEVKEKASSDLKLFKIYQKNWIFYSVGFLLSLFPVFLFNYIALILKHLRSGDDLKLGEVFSFDDWKNKLIFGIIFALCTSVCFALLFVPGVFFLSMYVYAIHVFSEKKFSFKKALNESKSLTNGLISKNAISIIFIILFSLTPTLLPIVVSFLKIPFLGLILAPVGLLNFLIMPLIHIYLCKKYIYLTERTHSHNGGGVSDLEKKGKDGIIAKGISSALEEIESFRPILNQCGFIIGNIKIETALALPPVANVGFSIEQKSDSQSDLSTMDKLPNLSKIQKSIVSSLKMILKLDDVVARHNMTIGIFDIKVGTKPGFEVSLYSTKSRAFNAK